MGDDRNRYFIDDDDKMHIPHLTVRLNDCGSTLLSQSNADVFEHWLCAVTIYFIGYLYSSNYQEFI